MLLMCVDMVPLGYDLTTRSKCPFASGFEHGVYGRMTNFLVPSSFSLPIAALNDARESNHRIIPPVLIEGIRHWKGGTRNISMSQSYNLWIGLDKIKLRFFLHRTTQLKDVIEVKHAARTKGRSSTGCFGAIRMRTSDHSQTIPDLHMQSEMLTGSQHSFTDSSLQPAKTYLTTRHEATGRPTSSSGSGSAKRRKSVLCVTGLFSI